MPYYLISVIYVFTLFLPASLFVEISGVRLEPYRVFLLVILALFMSRIISSKKKAGEIILIFYCFVGMVAFLKNYGPAGIQKSVMLFLEVYVSFLVGKYCAYEREVNTERLLKVVAYVLLLFIPFAIVEATNGYRVLHVAAAAVFDSRVEAYLGDEYIRYGIHRASIFFDHPIHYGVVSVLVGVIISILAPRHLKMIFVTSMIFAAVVSVSSVAFLMLMLVVLILLIERISRRVGIVRTIATYVIVGVLAFIELFSNQGAIQFLIMNFTLNQWTAYSRYLQWIHAWDDIMANKLFGVPYMEWSRPHWMHADSLDAYWLKVSLYTGFVTTLLVIAFWFVSILRMHRTYIAFNSKVMLAMYCAFLALTFGTLTVDLFGKALPFVYLLFGLACGYADRLEDKGIGAAKRIF